MKKDNILDSHARYMRKKIWKIINLSEKFFEIVDFAR
jgi:hypothetical protein